NHPHDRQRRDGDPERQAEPRDGRAAPEEGRPRGPRQRLLRRVGDKGDLAHAIWALASRGRSGRIIERIGLVSRRHGNKTHRIRRQSRKTATLPAKTGGLSRGFKTW